MKTVIVFVLAFAYVLALPEQEYREKFKRANEKCNADPTTAVSKEDMEKWHNDRTQKPANLGSHALCVSKAVGWQDANGKLRADVLKDGIREKAPTAEEANKIISHCVVEKENEAETAEHLMACFAYVARKRNEKH